MRRSALATSACALRALRQRIRHPGPPPPGWAGLAGVIVGGTALAVVALLGLGYAGRGRAAAYFAEGAAGTWLSALLLMATGVAAGATARRAAGAPARRFWTVAAVGFVLLGADDLLMWHETVDVWLHRMAGRDPRHPLTDHLDDAIVVGYGVLAALWVKRHRAHLAGLRWTTTAGSAAFAVAVLMALLDVTSVSTAAEESLKALAAALFLVAVLAARLDPALACPGPAR